MCELIEEAWEAGARLAKACGVVGIHVKTFWRWKRDPEDRRRGCRKKNPRALTEEERAEIVARLQEEGMYRARVRTFYRVLKEAGKVHHRGNSRPARKPYTPPELQADGPGCTVGTVPGCPPRCRGVLVRLLTLCGVSWSV